MLPTVHIRKEAFLEILWASMETFKSECLGFLWGRSPTVNFNRFLISDAVPFQSVRRRKNTEVEQSKRGERRLQELMQGVRGSTVKLLGYFHSHPEWGNAKPWSEMSEFDIKEMQKSGDQIEIIVSISSRKKGVLSWTLFPDGNVRGSFNKFTLDFNAYTLFLDNNKKKGVPKRLQIVAPAALKFLNRIQKH